MKQTLERLAKALVKNKWVTKWEKTIWEKYTLSTLRKKLQSSENCGSFSFGNPNQHGQDSSIQGSPIKYGLLRYGSVQWENYVLFGEQNIGDYIQSLAARQFLPQVDTLIDRDAVASYQGDRVRVIMNGWWRKYEGNATTSQEIDPLYVSVHLNEQNNVPPEAIEHFKRYEPIGCRDHSTTEFLQKHGVNAYFSGCLTLTLGKTYAVPPEERTNTIYYVDFDPSIFVNYVKSKWHRSAVSFTPQKIRSRLRDIIKTVPGYEKCQHICRAHMVPLSLSEEERFRLADMYLRDYARAQLVITSRIHCALPCAGMGVPAILVMPNPRDPRYGGITELLNNFGVDTSGEIIEHLFMPSETSGMALGNSPKIPAIVDALSKKCWDFVNAP